MLVHEKLRLNRASMADGVYGCRGFALEESGHGPHGAYGGHDVDNDGEQTEEFHDCGSRGVKPGNP